MLGTVSAQELVPRAYWPTPNGTNVFIVSYQRSTGDIVTDPSLQRNSRIGATVVYPLVRGHAIRSSYSTGVVVETGGDFEIFTLSYLYIW